MDMLGHYLILKALRTYSGIKIMEQVIKVMVVSVLGFTKYKPIDANAKLFVSLLRSKHLTLNDIEIIKKLGFKVEVASDIPKEL